MVFLLHTAGPPGYSGVLFGAFLDVFGSGGRFRPKDFDVLLPFTGVLECAVYHVHVDTHFRGNHFVLDQAGVGRRFLVGKNF